MEMKFKTKIKPCTNNRTIFHLNTIKKFGIGETLLLSYLNWNFNICPSHPCDFNLNEAETVLGIPVDTLVNEIIPNIQKLKIGEFTICDDKCTFTPNESFGKILSKLLKGKTGRKVILLRKVANEFNFRDAYNLGVLFGLVLENDMYTDGKSFELKFEPKWIDDFYPDLIGLFDLLVDLHSKNHGFIVIGHYQDYPDDLFICFYLEELKKYFEEKGGNV